MEQTVFELDLLEEARDFLKSLTKEIRVKNNPLNLRNPLFLIIEINVNNMNN